MGGNSCAKQEKRNNRATNTLKFFNSVDIKNQVKAMLSKDNKKA